MKNRIVKISTACMSALLAFLGSTLPALAALADNPATGDVRGQRMGLVVGILIVSVIVIVVFLAMSSKKGGKGKKK